jgi:hypothetical protein
VTRVLASGVVFSPSRIVGETQPSARRHNLGSGRGQIASNWAITVSYRSAPVFFVTRFAPDEIAGDRGLLLPVAIVSVVWLGTLAASVSAIVAQPVAAAEMHGSFPYGKLVLM